MLYYYSRQKESERKRYRELEKESKHKRCYNEAAVHVALYSSQ